MLDIMDMIGRYIEIALSIISILILVVITKHLGEF